MKPTRNLINDDDDDDGGGAGCESSDRPKDVNIWVVDDG